MELYTVERPFSNQRYLILTQNVFRLRIMTKANDSALHLWVGNVYGFHFEKRTWKDYGRVNEEFNDENAVHGTFVI